MNETEKHQSVLKSSMLYLSLIVLSISINVLFGLLNIINLLKIRFYHFYSLRIINITFFSPSIDCWIWCTSLILVIVEMFLMLLLHHLSLPRWLILIYPLPIASLAIFLVDSQVATFVTVPLGLIVIALSTYYSKGFTFAKREEAAILVFIGIIGLLIPLELASLSSWLLNAFDHEAPFGSGLRWRFPTFDLNLFNVLYPLTSWLLLILLYCWIWIPISRHLSLGMMRNHSPSIHTTVTVKRRHLLLALSITSAVAVFVAYYPYIHLPPPALVGVDAIYYYDFLTRMTEDGPYIALGSDRPAFRLLLYFIKSATKQPSDTIIRIMPAICTVGVALTVFWFVKTGTEDDHLALLSSALSVFSFQTTTGMYGNILASWFNITETMLIFTFLLKSLKKHSITHSLISGLISIAALLTHPYTWLIMTVILVSYIVLTILIRTDARRDVFLSSIPMVITSLALVSYFICVQSKDLWKLLNSIWNTFKSNLDISKIIFLQPSLSLMVQRWAGGGFGNPLMIALAILGMASTTDLTKRFQRLILCWILVPSLVIIAFVPALEDLYWRTAYVIPFQIPAAIGLQSLLSKLKSMLCDSNSTAAMTYFKLFKILFITLVILLFFNYSLRTVDEAMIQIPRA